MIQDTVEQSLVRTVTPWHSRSSA